MLTTPTWALALLLTAASRISRQSQGKANLWVVNDVEGTGERRVMTLRSQRFVGAFTLEQLKHQGDYRNLKLPVADDVRPQDLSVAAIAGKTGDVEFKAVPREQGFVSRPETKLGTTHILGIPLCDHEQLGALQGGDFVAITVDYRLNPFYHRLLGARRGLQFRRIRSRADQIREVCEKLDAMQELHPGTN